MKNNEPKILNLFQMLDFYLRHQKDIVTRRTQHDLKQAEDRAHILEGLLIALDNIDEVISIIRSSPDSRSAKEQLSQRFNLTDIQAQAIIDMRLRSLTGLEREKLETEHDELMIKIAEYKLILSDDKRLLGVIKDEITIIRDTYGDQRRTRISMDDSDLSMEDLIPDAPAIIAMSKLYIKRMDTENFKPQNRGGKGIKGMQIIEEDIIEDLLLTSNHHYILFFTNKGRTYRLKAYEIPSCSRVARGTATVNLLQLLPDERITAMIPLNILQVCRNVIDELNRSCTCIEFNTTVEWNGLIAKNPRFWLDEQLFKDALKDIFDDAIQCKIPDKPVLFGIKYGLSANEQREFSDAVQIVSKYITKIVTGKKNAA